MGDQRRDGIAWTDETWNPIRGCSRVSEGCRNCYAERMAARFSGPGQPYEGLARVTDDGPKWTGKVRLVEEHLADPLRWKRPRPRRIFVNSMSDLFHEGLSNEEIAAVFGVMAACPQHTFQVLTKRAKRMREWFVWAEASAEEPAPDMCQRAALARKVDVPLHPIKGTLLALVWPLPNVWLGVSVEDQRTADERIPLLLETPAAVRWVSYEPALGPVDFERVRWPHKHHVDVLRGGTWEMPPFPGFVQHSDMKTLDWIVIGGESGPNARPFDVAWARGTIAACKAAGVPCFVKQLGARPIQVPAAPIGRHVFALCDRAGADPAEWPKDLRVREWPVDARGAS